MKLPLKEYTRLLSGYLRQQRKQLSLLFLVLVSSIGLQLVNPQIIRFFIDNATRTDGLDSQQLTLAALVFIGSALLVQLLKMGATYLSQTVGWKATNHLRLDLIGHCLQLDMDFHKEHQAGELLERVDGDVNSLFNFFSKFMLNVFNNILLLIGILVLLVVENLLVGLCLTAFAALAMLVLWLLQSRKADVVVEYRKESAGLFGFLGEQLASTEDIRANGAKAHVMNRYFSILRTLLPLRIGSAMNYYNMWSSTLFIFAVGNAIAFGLSAYLWSKGVITIGAVYLIFYYTELLVAPIERIRAELQDLQKATAGITRIRELFALSSSLPEGTHEFSQQSASIQVALRDVTFGYADGDSALKNLSFDAQSGSVTGVIGHSGSGKTTLARLLVRLYDISSGSILLNGRSIRDYSTQALRKHIAYVTQDVQLFRASVSDNLTMFNREISDQAILDALDRFGLTPWYTTLSNGLSTRIEANGGGLSAGEAQLLAFVRVFLKNPSMIILDEATSRLDPITEQLVEKALDKLIAGRTCIIIAHRLWTVKRADQILILEKGQTVEFGNREALAKDENSRLFHLLQMGIEEVLV